jgi:hypothetical protein
MLTVAALQVQQGAPAKDADIIPPVQLATGSTSTTTIATSIGVIFAHQNAISHTEYLAPLPTTPLHLDGLTFTPRSQRPSDSA